MPAFSWLSQFSGTGSRFPVLRGDGATDDTDALTALFTGLPYLDGRADVVIWPVGPEFRLCDGRHGIRGTLTILRGSNAILDDVEFISLL